MALSVAHSIPEEYRRAFADNLEFVVQQEIGKLGSRVKVDSFTGKEKIYNDMETLSFTRRTGRLTASNPTEIELHARKLVKLDFKCQVIFDRMDKEFLGSLGRPDSETLQSMRMAWNRLVDEKICEAADATVYGGEEPYVTAIDLPSTQIVEGNYVHTGNAANSHMTPWKIIEAANILEENEVDPLTEECILVMNPRAKAELMEYVEAGDNETWANMIAAWLNNPNGKLFGFQVVLTNRLEDNGTEDLCFAYSRNRGIICAPDKLETSIDVRPDLDHAVQISAYGTYGFMRRYEKTVVQIQCVR